VSTIAVKSMIAGTLERVLFEEGDEVEAGQVLFEIDARPYRLALQQAKATLARDEAQLRNAEADARRNRRLLPSGVVARSDYDLKVAQAGALRATVQVDRAAIDQAQVNLSYTRIASPVAGRTGSLQVDAGNLVKANDVPLVTIRTLQPIDVAFSIPGQRLDAVRRRFAKAPLTAYAAAKGAAGAPEQGRLAFIDNAIDPATGTILLKARFDNADRGLWPGEFLDVRLVLDELPDAVVVAARAVQPGQQGDHVFVVGQDDVAQERKVELGERLGDEVVIASGVRTGERVVVDGLLGIVPGAKVAPRAEPGPQQAEAAR
jgi:multidrug efflux system membrane fusion protein